MNLKKTNLFAALGLASGAAFAQEAAETVPVDVTEAAREAGNQFWAALHIEEFTEFVKSFVTWPNMLKIITSVLAIVLFYIVYRVIKHLVEKAATKALEPHTVKLVTKAVSYVFYVLMVMYVLSCFGIKLSAIWGAAGIAGVAIGFAAQTSVSNLISGLFVVTDKAMKIGDFIEVGGISGTVDEVGIISVKIHTLDNQMIRIPNSTIINSNLKNYSAFPFRRYVFELSVDYGSDIDKTLEVLKSVPARCPTVLTDDPDHAPNAVYTTLGDSGINMNLIVWCKSPDFLQTKHDVCVNVLKAFNENGVNIPFNRMDVTLLNENTVPSVNLKA